MIGNKKRYCWWYVFFYVPHITMEFRQKSHAFFDDMLLSSYWHKHFSFCVSEYNLSSFLKTENNSHTLYTNKGFNFVNKKRFYSCFYLGIRWNWVVLSIVFIVAVMLSIVHVFLDVLKRIVNSKQVPVFCFTII